MLSVQQQRHPGNEAPATLDAFLVTASQTLVATSHSAGTALQL